MTAEQGLELGADIFKQVMGEKKPILELSRNQVKNQVDHVPKHCVFKGTVVEGSGRWQRLGSFSDRGGRCMFIFNFSFSSP